ncbi:MAG: peptide ABC transporter substrate-binding protein [Bdellovibrionaceae bacterium]|jgi:oligopeptide transport system substrate-binding protein|nr:peptide ABC transporter substrate-binding protein [Pseudobdellovibrionaceae bacterium]
MFLELSFFNKKQLKYFLILLFLITQAGCFSKKKANKNNNILVVNGFAEPESFDWHLDGTGSEVVDALAEQLIHIAVTSGKYKLKPGIVNKWSRNKKGDSWLINIRSDIKWSDGKPLETQHVLDSFIRLLNPKVGAKGVQQLFNIKNAKNFFEGKINNFKEVGINQVGTNQIRFTLDKPMSHFPYILTQASLSPIRLDILKKFTSPDLFQKNLATLSPFTLMEHKPGEYSILKRNPLYYGKPAETEKIKVLHLQSQITGVRLFETGKIHLQIGLPAENLNFYKKLPTYRNEETLALGYIAFNLRKKPMQNKWLRRAIAQAIDPNEVVKVLGGNKKAISLWMPRPLRSWDSLELEKNYFNPKLAKKWLKKSGYDVHSKPNITLLHHIYENHQLMCENIQQQLKKNLGLNIELNKMEWKFFLNQVRNDPPQIYRLGQSPSLPHATAVLNMLSTELHSVNTGWNNPTFESLLQKALLEKDKSKLDNYILEATKIIAEEAPVVPIYSGNNDALVSQKIKKIPSFNITNLLAYLSFN